MQQRHAQPAERRRRLAVDAELAQQGRAVVIDALAGQPVLRIDVEPDTENGLERPSQVCVDKAITVPRTRIGRRIGQLEQTTLLAVNTALARFRGLTT